MRRELPNAVVPKTRDFERTTFGPFGRRVLYAIGEAFFTDPNDPADERAPDRFAWLVDDVDDMVSHAGGQLQNGLRAGLVVLELLPLFVIGRFARASSLPLETRERYLAKLESSSFPFLPLIVVAFKTLMTVLYFEHPEAAPHLGYDGRHERFKVARKLAVVSGTRSGSDSDSDSDSDSGTSVKEAAT